MGSGLKMDEDAANGAGGALSMSAALPSLITENAQ
jgi:hypothetical protein